MQGIPYTATEADIARFFNEAGVVPIRIHRRHNGGECYVEFSTVSDARQAMTLHKAHMGKRYIELFRVSFQEMASVVGVGALTPHLHPGLGDLGGLGGLGVGSGGGGGLGMTGLSGLGTSGALSGIGGTGGFGSSMFGASKGIRMKMQGLPYRATGKDIVAFFSGYDLLPEAIEFGQDQLGRPSGEAWVYFKTLESARAAHREKNQQYIGERYVKLFLD